jgi:peptidoglycan/LPS O-acetylase OafA/YrhL
MVGVVATHILVYSAPIDSIEANAILMFLHVNRELFFFVSAFVLFYATGAGTASLDMPRFWRRRYPLVVGPYLAWTLIYWPLSNGVPWPPGPALQVLWTNVTLGWFHLYFLLVTMQFYLVFPVLAWLVRVTRPWHGWVLLVSAVLQIGMSAWIQYWWDWIPWPGQWVLQWGQVEFPTYQFYFVAGALAAARLDTVLAWMRAHRRLTLGLIGVGLVVGEGWYGLNLALGEDSATAAGVLQPAVLVLSLACIAGLWVLAERWLRTHALDGRLWSSIRLSADSSFGVYLVHMVPLLVLTQPPVLYWLPTDHLPWPVEAVVRFLVVVAVTAAMIWVFRHTPLSLLLTGRRRSRPRVGGGAEARASA